MISGMFFRQGVLEPEGASMNFASGVGFRVGFRAQGLGFTA